MHLGPPCAYLCFPEDTAYTILFNGIKVKKVKISLFQAVEAQRVERG
jgi:hypothetical protein